MTVWTWLLWQARKALERITMRDRRTERAVPDYVQQLWDSHVQLQNNFDQLQQEVVNMATQQQIDQLTERVQSLKDSLTHASGEIRTELSRLSGEGVDTSGLESALDNLASEVQSTEDIIPDADTGSGSGGETPTEPGNAPPDPPADITQPVLGTDPEPAPVDPNAPHVDNTLPEPEQGQGSTSDPNAPSPDNTLPGEPGTAPETEPSPADPEAPVQSNEPTQLPADEQPNETPGS